MQKQKVIPSTMLIQMKRDKETLKNDIQQLLEVLLVLRPWTLLCKEPLDTCSEEPWEFWSLFQQYDHCLFLFLDLTNWDKINGGLIYTSKVFFTPNPGSWFWKKRELVKHSKGVVYMVFTCIQCCIFGKLLSTATHSCPDQSPVVSCRQARTPKNRNLRAYFLQNMKISEVTVLQNI